MQNVASNLLTTSEAARSLRVCEQTIRNLERRGILQADRLGNGTRVFERAIVDALKTKRERS